MLKKSKHDNQQERKWTKEVCRSLSYKTPDTFNCLSLFCYDFVFPAIDQRQGGEAVSLDFTPLVYNVLALFYTHTHMKYRPQSPTLPLPIHYSASFLSYYISPTHISIYTHSSSFPPSISLAGIIHEVREAKVLMWISVGAENFGGLCNKLPFPSTLTVSQPTIPSHIYMKISRTHQDRIRGTIVHSTSNHYIYNIL